MTETPLQLIIEATIRSGKKNDLQQLAKKAGAEVEKKEPGTLDYRWVVDDDGHHVRFLDTYASSKDFVSHFGKAQDNGVMDEMMSCVEMGDCHVIGNPDPEARRILDDLGARYFHPIGGFNRLQTPAMPQMR